MINIIRQIFNPKNKDLRSRVLYTLFALTVLMIGTTISVPGTKPIIGETNSVINLLNLMSGNALKQYSIFALGVMPYITASIVIQMLAMDVIPYLSDLKEQGAAGQQKMNKITRYVGIILAFVNAFAYTLMFERNYDLLLNNSPFTYLYVAVVLTCGTAFLLWLGDQITQKGIGNGLSLIIMAGIVSGLPNMFGDAFSSLVDTSTTQSAFVGGLGFAVFVLVYVAIIVGVIFIQEAARKIPIQHSNRTQSAYGGAGTNFIPIKVNSAGVIPVIFAGALLGAPGIIASLLNLTTVNAWIDANLNYTQPFGFALYMGLIFMFAYFYTFIQIKPEDVADNLKRQGAYIPGIKPGDDTATYIRRILGRLTFVGATFICLIAGLPVLFATFSSLPGNVQLGGTGLLIVVGVAIETIRQVEGKLVSKYYKGYISK
jgi:preprotein translocase subunit SecY